MSQLAKITAAAPQWSLSDLYADRADPRIAADIDAARAANDALAELEGQFVATRAEPAKLGELIDRGVRLYEQAAEGLYAVGAFASLSASTARDDAKWAKFEADFRMKSAEIASKSLFFTLELNQLEDAEIEAALAAHAAAERWRPWRVEMERHDPTGGRHGGGLVFSARDYGWAEDELTYAAKGNFPYQQDGAWSGTVEVRGCGSGGGRGMRGNVAASTNAAKR